MALKFALFLLLAVAHSLAFTLLSLSSSLSPISSHANTIFGMLCAGGGIRGVRGECGEKKGPLNALQEREREIRMYACCNNKLALGTGGTPPLCHHVPALRSHHTKTHAKAHTRTLTDTRTPADTRTRAENIPGILRTEDRFPPRVTCEWIPPCHTLQHFCRLLWASGGLIA